MTGFGLKSNFKVLIATSIFAAASFMPLNIMPLLLGSAADTYGLSNTQIGNIGSSFLLGFTLLSVSAVLWVEKIDWRKVLGSACLLAGLGFVVFIKQASLISNYMFWVLLGFIAAAPYTVVVRILSEAKDTNRAFGFVTTIQIGSSALLLWLLPNYFIPHWGFDSIVLALFIGFLIAIPGVFFLPRSSIEVSNNTVANMEKIQFNRETLPVWISLLCIFVFISGQIGLWAFLERIGHQQTIPIKQLGNILAILKIIGALAGVTLFLLGTRYKGRTPHIVCTVIVLFGVFLLASNKGLVSFAIGAWLWEYGYSLYYIYMYALIAVLDPSHRLIVLTPAVVSLGAAFGPATAGKLSYDGNFLFVFLFSVITILISALIMSHGFIQQREIKIRVDNS